MTTINVAVIGFTQPSLQFKGSTLEDILGYTARVSNPSGQDKFDTQRRLFEYCMRNRHWSIFQIANIVLEIEAPRDITRQFLRHDSLYVVDDEIIPMRGFDKRFGGVQEFSQRYSEEFEFTEREFRRQDTKNRQNSINDLPQGTQDTCNEIVESSITYNSIAYEEMRKQNVAKECARVILPEGLTMSRLYVNGTVRSWLHYLDVRNDPGVTQHEHVEMAIKVQDAIQPIIPSLIKI